MNKILEILNSQQRSAVTSASRFSQIIAGPGTGKTTTLAAKILYVQTELGVDTDKILGISFSKSAKSHLLNKIEEFTSVIGYGGKPSILTFHSLAHRIIKYGIHFKESRFRVGFGRISTDKFIDLDPTLIKDLCTEYANRELVNSSLSHIYNMIRQGSIEDSPIHSWSDINPNKSYHDNTYTNGRVLVQGKDLITFWRRIHTLERIKNVTDFQGLITEAIRILSLKQRTYNYISQSLQHIFIDEYQDTSLAQEELLLRLINLNQFVTVVGDKYQTIYTFNGSNSKNMDRFATYCEKNSPLSFEIVNLNQNYRSTREIITVANDFIGEGTIESANNRKGIKPKVIETHSVTLAAEYIAKKICELIKEKKVTLSDICILYRKNSEYSPQADEVYKKLDSYSIRYNTQHQNEKKVESLIEQVLHVRDKYEDEPLDEVLEKLKVKEASNELITFINDVIKQGALDTDDLTEYIVEIEEDPNYELETDCITVRTVHDAKGLEYPIVFILYVGDREFPHSSRPDMEEEKRLFYVALTRAQNQLYILGKKGIEFESFLDKCILSESAYNQYHSSNNEEKNDGFTNLDKEIIDKTTIQQEEEEIKQQEELRKLMDFF
ncbi:ATP-dependent helicase [Sutcliffiella sp. NC1]|uniref:ATP-dependent helicase n=1 Tax=Sutcliffiella sp. NC1 TaxID=3004096 RepID=UPI0022DD5AAC|nr:ATP-dependent helicase [Sutcliffiella sp. NC1]WBL16873.1 ATP-dependent helicase [Sutcliffiella sp. NC1]